MHMGSSPWNESHGSILVGKARVSRTVLLLVQERGVVCKACSEKEQLVKTVRDNIHLPAKKEHLKKFANMPKTVEDEEVRIRRLRKRRQCAPLLVQRDARRTGS